VEFQTGSSKQKIVNKADGKSTATASLERIVGLDDTCFVVATLTSKKKQNKLVGFGPTKKDLNQRMLVKTIYSLQGFKCHALQGPREEVEESEQLDKLNWSNEDVDLDEQHCKLLVPQSQLYTDTAYLSHEVELYLLQNNSSLG
jgi:hypothetical protein